MATDPLQVLSVEQAKAQLSIEPDRDDLNARITQSIRAAIAYVQRKTGVPLINRDEAVYSDPRSNDPIRIPHRHVLSIASAEFWELSQDVNAEPTGSIAVNALGRRQEGPAWTEQYPPNAGWPTRLHGTPIKLVCTLGVDIDIHSEDLRFEVIIQMRHFFENPDDIGTLRGLVSLGSWELIE